MMEKQIERKRQSGSFLAWVLIIFGVLWILKQSGWDIHFPHAGAFLHGIGHLFTNLAHWLGIATLPLLIILAGIVLLSGRKFFGALLLVILLLILIPGFLIVPGILMILFFPLILIVIGIIILSKLF